MEGIETAVLTNGESSSSLKACSAVELENEVLAFLDATIEEVGSPTDDIKCRTLSTDRNSLSSSGLSSLGRASQESLDSMPTVSIAEARDPFGDAAYASDDLLNASTDSVVTESHSVFASSVPSEQITSGTENTEEKGQTNMDVQSDEDARSRGSILLGGVVMSVNSDEIEAYHEVVKSKSDSKLSLSFDDGCSVESKSSGTSSIHSLTAIYESPSSPCSTSAISPPPISPSGTINLDPSDYKWDELGRMQSTLPRIHRPVPKRILSRSGSETEFLMKNVEMKTVSVTKPKKGSYGFSLKGDGPVWIGVVDKGSVAEAAGLTQGGVLIEVNGRNVEEANHDTVLRYIMEGPQPLIVTFQLTRDWSSTSSAPVMSGYLTKQGGTGITPRNWRKRWFVLREDGCLYYYKNEKDIRPLGAIVMQGYTVSKALDIDKKGAFKLIKGGARTYYMYTETETEMNSWARALTEASGNYEGCLANSTGSCAHNVSIPALSIRDAECHGWLYKQGGNHKNWKRRYCVLKDKCLYYYKEMTDQTALGVMKMQGYKMAKQPPSGKKLLFSALPPADNMRTFYFYTLSELEFSRWFQKMEESIAQEGSVSI